MYGKIFASLYTGSMVGSGPLAFAVWAYIIANKDQDGFVELNCTIISATIGKCTSIEIQDCLDLFCQPDPRSRSKEEDGRRLIQEGEFLYRVVNAKAYDEMVKSADKRAYMKKYMKSKRDKQDRLPCKLPVSQMLENPSISISKSSLGEECEKGVGSDDPVAVVFNAWNKHRGKKTTKDGHRVMWHEHHKVSPEIVNGVKLRMAEYSIDEIVSAIDNYASVLFDTETYWTYTWTLPEFLSRKQGKEKISPLQIIRFLPDNFHPDQFLSLDKSNPSNSGKAAENPWGDPTEEEVEAMEARLEGKT